MLRRRSGVEATFATFDELIGHARAGKVRFDDRIVPPGGGDAKGPHDFPELGIWVRTGHEYLARRSARAVTGFLACVGPLLLLVVVTSAARGHGIREPLAVLVMFAGVFGIPAVFLRHQAARLEAQRRAGSFSPPLPGPEEAALNTELRRMRTVRVLVWTNVLAGLAGYLVGQEEWLQALAKVNDKILAGEWWRLVTPMFVHANLMHLLFNVAAISGLAPLVEVAFGTRRLLAIYLLGGLVGVLASFLADPRSSVGASGAIFALLGAALVHGYRRRAELASAVRDRYFKQPAIWLVVNLVFGAVAPFVDNAAHLGGFAAGVLFAFLAGSAASPASVQA